MRSLLSFGSLFAGIGGFDLGFERAGMKCLWQVEIDDYATKVNTKHWPDVPKFRDIRDCGKHNLATVDVICGGFPCQPFSKAGKRRCQADDRYLWPEMFRVVSELQPSWVVCENVAEFVNVGLDTTIADLESQNYEVWSFIIPACAVGAPHQRNRVFIIAHTKSEGLEGADAAWKTRADGWFMQRAGRDWWTIEPGICRVAHGISKRVDRIRCLGNAVVPQLAEVIGMAIVEVAQMFGETR